MDISRIIKPERLKNGDTIGIISPASPVNKEKLEKGINYLKRLGFDVRLGKHIYDEMGYLAGTNEDRVSDLHSFFDDGSIKAIFCSRGGFGSIKILNLVDFELIENNPKIFVGYSDLTALENSIFTKTGLVTFYGPFAAADKDDEIDYSAFDNLLRIISKKDNTYKINISEDNIITGGKAAGIIVGGCLSVFSSLLGSDYLPDLRDTIIFLEDVNEEPYRIDRYLSQLRLNGVFEEIKGLIFGRFIDCEPKNGNTTVDDIINEIGNSLDIPVIKDVSFGHIRSKITIPVGIRTTMNTESMCISFDENLVV